MKLMILVLGFLTLKAFAGNTLSWTAQGTCAEVTSTGEVRLVKVNKCRKEIGSNYILVKDVCSEYTPDGVFIRTARKSVCLNNPWSFQ